MRTRRNSSLAPTTPPSIRYNDTPTGALPDSPDKQSVCQSPSWEVYDRRKKEKKQEKKKNKEEAKAQGRRTARLSKPPPASSPYMFYQANAMAAASEANVADRGRRARPLSGIGLPSSSNDAPKTRSRSRTGSFTNLLRAPFEFRRNSIDHNQAPSSGFVGGIKLEIERHEAKEAALRTPRPEDTEVHPAFRTSPTISQPTVASVKATNKETNHRFYPPITRMPVPARASGIPPSASTPDLNALQRLKARVVRKSHNESQSNLSPAPDAMARFASSESLMTQPLPAHPMVKMVKEQEITNQNMPARNLTPPPQPPRRSSKRNSGIFTDKLSVSSVSSRSSNDPSSRPVSPISPVSATHPHTDAAASPALEQVASAPPQAPSASPSWENLRSSVMDTIDKSVRPVSEVDREMWKADEWKTRHPFVMPAPTCSSEDSGSDGFFSVTGASTPCTSRPQSEKDMGRSSSITSEGMVRVDSLESEPGQNSVTAAKRGNTNGSVREHEMHVMETVKPLRLRSRNFEKPSLDFAAYGKPEGHKPVAKVFVECCSCKYYHDMPSKLYEAMADPKAVLDPMEQSAFAGSISMTVKCPWCKHEMTTNCCAGYAAMVYIRKKLH